MSVSAQKFRKKPVEIEAMHLSSLNATRIIDWILSNGGTARYVSQDEPHYLRRDDECEPQPVNRAALGRPLPGAAQFVVIDTLEGAHRAEVDDWVIRGVAGEFYPCKPDIFTASYEAIEETRNA